MGGVAEFYTRGGFFMHPILLMSIIGLGIIIERFVALLFKYNVNAGAFMGQIQKLVMANEIDRAIKLCNAAPAAAVPQVMKAGLKRANKTPEEIHSAVEEATLEVVPVVTRRTRVLYQIANLAVLLGILGTIFGLMEAFGAVAESALPIERRQGALAAGISGAMNTTAFGLTIAVMCLAAQTILSSVRRKIIDEVDQYSVKLQNLLVSRLHGGVADDGVAP